jgi:hypothetical protein
MNLTTELPIMYPAYPGADYCGKINYPGMTEKYAPTKLKVRVVECKLAIHITITFTAFTPTGLSFRPAKPGRSPVRAAYLLFTSLTSYLSSLNKFSSSIGRDRSGWEGRWSRILLPCQPTCAKAGTVHLFQLQLKYFTSKQSTETCKSCQISFWVLRKNYYTGFGIVITWTNEL